MKPLVFNCYKPAQMSSYDVIRQFKRNIPKAELGKIGHFGTLDPFACGVLLIGVSGAQRLNNLIHDELSKTYLACGQLGVDYDTGDMTGECLQTDESDYLKNEISQFSVEFIQEQLEKKFLGEYWQSPHKYSAAKFEGKKLYEYAREGIEIKKEKKQRFIHKLEVTNFEFPYLTIRFEVSSGTYIRTLFSECAQYLGTLGTLKTLEREKVGDISKKDSIPFDSLPGNEGFDISMGMRPDEAFACEKIILNEKLSVHYTNGVPLATNQLDELNEEEFYWVYNNKEELLGLSKPSDGKLKSQFIFPLSSS